MKRVSVLHWLHEKKRFRFKGLGVWGFGFWLYYIQTQLSVMYQEPCEAHHGFRADKQGQQCWVGAAYFLLYAANRCDYQQHHHQRNNHDNACRSTIITVSAGTRALPRIPNLPSLTPRSLCCRKCLEVWTSAGRGFIQLKNTVMVALFSRTPKLIIRS